MLVMDGSVIDNPFLALFRDKLPQPQVDAFLELEMNIPKLVTTHATQHAAADCL